MPETPLKSREEIRGELRKALPSDFCDVMTGGRIAKRRRQTWPNRRELAKILPGISLEDIRRIETSYRQPRLDELMMLALFLEAPVDSLAWGRGPKVLGPQEKMYILLFLGMPRAQVYQEYRADIARRAARSARK